MLVFCVLLIVVVVIHLMILGTGVASFFINNTVTATICEWISRFAFAASMCALMIFVIPRIREIFVGFGVELSPATVLVLNITTLNLWQVILLSLMMLFGVIVDGILFWIFHEQPSTRRITQWCSCAITLFLTAVAFFIIAALYVPVVKLINSLS